MLISTVLSKQTPANTLKPCFTPLVPFMQDRRIGAWDRAGDAAWKKELSELQRLAALGKLSAEIAHEINNPLNTILLAAENALRFPGEEDVALAFKIIRDEASRAGRITRYLLELAAGVPAQNTLVNLNEVVTDAVALARRYVGAHRLECTLDLADSLPAVSLNVTGIEQVIVNLLKNAAEAGNGLARVVVRTAKTTEGVIVGIADDGPGINSDGLRDLFTPFVSTKRNSGGTGLGLNISRRIISELGGELTAVSKLGLGTVFTICLNSVESSSALLTA
jgi:signal transduction histidine kinase